MVYNRINWSHFHYFVSQVETRKAIYHTPLRKGLNMHPILGTQESEEKLKLKNV